MFSPDELLVPSQKSYVAGTFTAPSLLMRKLEHREVKWLAKGHTAIIMSGRAGL